MSCRKYTKPTSCICIAHTDIDECQVDNGGCHPQRKCTNIPGSRRCGDCPAGMLKDGFTGCRSMNLQCPASVRTDAGYWADATKWMQGQVPTVRARARFFSLKLTCLPRVLQSSHHLGSCQRLTVPHSCLVIFCRKRISC